MNFVEAIRLLLQGKRIRRKCWRSLPTEHIVIEKFNGTDLVTIDYYDSYDYYDPFDPPELSFSHDDIIADDWEILE